MIVNVQNKWTARRTAKMYLDLRWKCHFLYVTFNCCAVRTAVPLCRPQIVRLHLVQHYKGLERENNADLKIIPYDQERPHFNVVRRKWWMHFLEFSSNCALCELLPHSATTTAIIIIIITQLVGRPFSTMCLCSQDFEIFSASYLKVVLHAVWIPSFLINILSRIFLI